MNKVLSGFVATALAASFAFGAALPAAAAPAFVPKAPQASADIQQIQYDNNWRRHRPMRMERPGINPRFVRRGDAYYFNGHRGYRDYRPGYRRYNDWWFPAGAFIAGAIIGGALNQPPPPRYVTPAYGNSHVQWCYNRYRSYRASDNTFQPYNGPRQQCYSPY
ncbi:BA14K family protein [Aminobacter sp. MET-1]|uniref:BA14K family protein n=1 Tax=Aminobacter sp. MET-1 TaxID=2951085 RepID=UPI00226AD6EC|nr:BA14K family protein [Aminobacter sp. MET-1]MCX8570040.1 BA14K family protein [Aminobacter sp. MET-1]